MGQLRFVELSVKKPSFGQNIEKNIPPIFPSSQLSLVSNPFFFSRDMLYLLFTILFINLHFFSFGFSFLYYSWTVKTIISENIAVIRNVCKCVFKMKVNFNNTHPVHHPVYHSVWKERKNKI